MGEQSRKRNPICAGLLAHVDAGKTTLSEAILYTTGQLKKLGRVDHKDAFLDTDSMERARGITIFSKQARLTLEDWDVTLVDTPGHVDFSAEAERVLQVLDYAILVISGTDGVQAHTRTLWDLLRQNHVPTFLFINKMDLPGPGAAAIMEACKKDLAEACVSFSQPEEAIFEEAALCDETVLEIFLETGGITHAALARLVQEEKLFPCCFGSALKLEGIEEFLGLLSRLAPRRAWRPEFAARVYKITRDPQGNRLTWLKVTGGRLKVRALLPYDVKGEHYEEKIKELRLYSGAKYTQTEEIEAGTLCALVGLSRTFPGQSLGCEPQGCAPMLEPVMTYALELPEGCDPRAMLPKLLELGEEDPQLHILWDERLRSIQVRLMGQVQIEVLKHQILDRFGVKIQVGAGKILYKETIENKVEGVGHYEPLRHYAEVHLLLEPLPRGSGLVFATACSENDLDRNWQRLILTHLLEKTHLGVLTGAPITDMQITLMAGKAHLKHTEGGDFRQATYRAVRQGLMQARSVLLEPCYEFRLTVPLSNLGRALTDLRAMTEDCRQSQAGEFAVLEGVAPVALLQNYAAQVAAYTRGLGRLSLRPGAYTPCKDQAALTAASGYDPEGDLDNTPDSVFCAHGAGFNVRWSEVPKHMHLPSCIRPPAPPPQAAPPRPTGVSDRELEAIMDREFGPIRRPQYQMPRVTAQSHTPEPVAPREEYLLVDGYNMLFAWESLKELAREDLEAARLRLMDILSNYAAFKHRNVVLVFDGYRVKGNRGERFLHHNLLVVYTRENETGDAYMEALIHAIGKHDRVWVATSDSLIQLSAFRTGILRLSARELQEEVAMAEKEMAAYLKSLDTAQRLRDKEAQKALWQSLLNRLNPSVP